MPNTPTESQVRRARIGVAVFALLAVVAVAGSIMTSSPNRAFLILGAGLASSMASLGVAGPWFRGRRD